MNDGFTGTGVALVTPFTSDRKIDFDALNRIVDHVTDGGVEHLVVLGTTGESATLSKEEKHAVIDTVVKANRKQLTIIVGIGGNNTAEVVDTIEQTDFKNIQAILSVAPYYNRPSQQGIYEHFAAIANASPIPVIIYNVPGRTASNISADTSLKLANDFKNIIGVKEASGNFVQIMQILKDRPTHFHVIAGDDTLTLPMIHMGASGVISVIANSHPRDFSDMVRAAINHDFHKANEIHYNLLGLIQTLFEEGSPTGVKASMELLGLCGRDVRLPLMPASENLIKKLKTLL
jgi:4-hydroxy-tetrahydrodipicolinate synthase